MMENYILTRLNMEKLELSDSMLSDLFGQHEKIKPAHVSRSSGNNEWYTPLAYIEAARAAMGGIDLDPASSHVANEVIGAKTYFSEDIDGLKKDWKGRLWMNPPFAQPFVKLFCEKVIYHFERGDISQACVLINNGTETRHGQMMLGKCSAACFTKGRIRFLAPDSITKNSPLQGQMIMYYGNNKVDFSNAFGGLGVVMFGQING